MRRWLPRLLIVASLALHAFTAACYIRQPDIMAAYTVYPIWMWGLLGLFLAALGFVFWRAPLSFMLVVLWSLTILIASDESHALAHIGYEKPEPGPAKQHNGQDTLRICTLNWSSNGQSEEEILEQAEILASYHPDIVFLQEIHPWQAKLIADKLYQTQGDYRTGIGSAIITRWKVHQDIPQPKPYSQQVTLKLPNGRLVDCINFHLSSARIDIRLWTKSCWINHAQNRKVQRREVTYSLEHLKQTTPFPTHPVVCAGDFNAPASDPLHDILLLHFNDSFSEAGTGWANTWHRRIPMHRLDYIYTSPLLKAVRSRTVKTPVSDHRMLVSDFLLIP